MSNSIGWGENHTKAQNEGRSYFSKDDLNYLSSLTEKEFKELHSSIVEACGGSESIEAIQTHNYMVLYDELTDNGAVPERMTRLKSFCEDYLTKKDGKSSLETLVPNDLTDLEVKIYASQAVFIDLVTRPVYDHIEEMELMKAYENDFPWCKAELGFRIALLGLKIGVEAFLDAMSEGIGTLELILDITDAGADVMDMWLQYEVCNGRWH